MTEVKSKILFSGQQFVGVVQTCNTLKEPPLYTSEKYKLMDNFLIVRSDLPELVYQINREGGQSGTYLRLTRASSGPRVSVTKTYRDENETEMNISAQTQRPSSAVEYKKLCMTIIINLRIYIFCCKNLTCCCTVIC